MENHQHTRIEFYSDAFEKPILVKCSECGDTLEVSADLLEAQYGDGPADSIKYREMTEDGRRYDP